jgi:hypothetical protein
MALELKNLDETTRRYMGLEIKMDAANGLVYRSKYLTEKGLQEWEDLLLEAALHHDSGWLAEQLRDEALAVPERQRSDRHGQSRSVRRLPENLADSEFNRYYMRGLSLRAIEENIPFLITYRAKEVSQPVSGVGVEVDPHLLLDDLRSHRKHTALNIPSNPNSGISVMLPERERED